MPKYARPLPQVDVDEAVEELAALLQRSGMTDEAIAVEVSRVRGHKMSPGTVRRVRELATRRPQNFTLTWIGWAIGYRRTGWEKI